MSEQKKEHVLVVDDTPMNLQLLSIMLSSRGYQVTAVESGPHALEAAQQAVPDLILLDIMMPDMDGYEVCERLKADAHTRDVPVIFISALEATDNKLKAFSAGGVDYVTKPFEVPEVLARVKTHIALRALQRELQEAKAALERQVTELQVQNEELDAFANAITQDLKKPLTSIIGFADTLAMSYRGLPPEGVEESVRSIARSGRQMDEIIDKLLLLAGVRQAESVEAQALDMAAIVARARARLAGALAERQAAVSAPDVWPAAEGYAPWVEEVWVAYIGDAVKNSRPAPHITLGATPVDNGTVRFWVHSDALEKGGKQRGLGPFIARRIMERLGRGAKEDPAGGDASYTFTLPAR